MLIHRITAALSALTVFLSAASFFPQKLTADSSFDSIREVFNNGTLKYGDLVFALCSGNGIRNAELIKYNGTGGDVIIPEKIGDHTVTAIGDHVFSGNMTINKVTLPDTLFFFGESVFSDSSLTEINIPEKVMIIPDGTFNNCTSLKTVDFHDNIAYCSEERAFSNTAIDVPDTISDKTSLSFVETSCYVNCSEGNWEYYLEADFTTSGYIVMASDFIEPESDMVIPETYHGIDVTDINSLLFIHADECSLHSLTIPKSVTKLSGIDYIDNSLDELIINSDIILSPVGVKGLEKLVINGSCKLNRSDFQDCQSLKSIEFNGEDADITISQNAFRGCTALSEVKFPESGANVNISSNAFENTGIRELAISGSGSLGSFAFANCHTLESVELNGEIALCGRTFSGCESLVSFHTTATTSPDTNDFCDCTSLSDVRLDISHPINGRAFNGCTSLTKLNGESIVGEDGKLVPKTAEFFNSSFFNTDDMGFVNEYVTARCSETVTELTNESMSDMEKVKVLHDWLCSSAVYDTENPNDVKNHNDISVFIGNTTVCEGYARTLNLLLNSAGIESCYVENGTHAWTMAKLGDHWFHIDSTWDDGEEVLYDWFLKTDSEMIAAGEPHNSWRIMKPSSIHSFQRDTLPQSTETMGDVDGNGLVNAVDASRILIAYADICAGKEPSSDTVLSDMNFDGMISAVDASCVLRKYAEMS